MLCHFSSANSFLLLKKVLFQGTHPSFSLLGMDPILLKEGSSLLDLLKELLEFPDIPGAPWSSQ